jgi:2-polyprenyl-6-methoxyphenol hydroxylase-like FAD-dependent oxidoreductase
MSTKSSRIVIVGAGLGGLVLARVLQMRGFDPIVYEREPSVTSRGQGGVLDMHVESGQRALIECGVEKEFRAAIKPSGEDTKIVDKTGRIFLDQRGSHAEGGRPEVERIALRQMLLDSLRPDTVRWGQGAREVNGSRMMLENGEIVNADLIVGADGAWSRVRRFLSDAKPTYCGISFIEMGIPNFDRDASEIAELVGHGKVMAISQSKGIIAGAERGRRVRVNIAFRCAEGWLAKLGIPFERPSDTRAALLDQFFDWDNSLRNLIARCDDECVVRPLWALPVGHRWAQKPGVTLLGDAAHLMSPFAGEGANLAMLDGLELGIAISEHHDLAAALTAFEEPMLARAEPAARESLANGELILSDDVQRVVAIMTGG